MYMPCMALLLASAATSDWRIWSPRAETAPVHRIEAQSGRLVLAGGGNPAVFGGWERDHEREEATNRAREIRERALQIKPIL